MTVATRGQVTSAFYGEASIPTACRDRLAMCEEITALADRLCRGGVVDTLHH